MRNIALKIAALIFGIAIWFFVISQKNFQLELEVPLNFVKLSENLAIASKPPHTLHITVEGKSWELIRLRQDFKQGNKNVVAMVVDMQKTELGPTRIHLDEKNFVAPNYPNIKFVEPENRLLFVDLDIDTRITRNVPIRSNISINVAQGYLQADEPKISPAEISVSGARNVLAKIIDIPTDSLKVDTLKASSGYTVSLNFSSFPAFVIPSDSSIQVSVDIQKMGTKTIKKVPVMLIGYFDRAKYRLSPDTLDVQITGGEKALDSISSESVQLIMEFNRFAIEDADSLQPTPRLILPASINRERAIKAIELKPDKVCLIKTDDKKQSQNEEAEEAAK